MIRVFIVDDHPAVVAGIHSLLSNEAEITWAGHALTAKSCVDYFEKESADVLLMDINLPDKNGLDLCSDIKAMNPGIMVLALSTLNQPSYINKMLGNGASGYILKNADKEELLEAIKTVANGEIYISAEASEIIKHASHQRKDAPFLTRREKEILVLLAEGFTTPEIAEKIFVSHWTVDGHRKSIMTKLNVKNTASLIKYAYENGLL